MLIDYKTENIKTQTIMREKLEKQNRLLLYFFSIALAVSGISAFPIETGLEIMGDYIPDGTWLSEVVAAYKVTNSKYPFIAYGTDWLGYAHLMLAILFWGAAKDPVKNKWIMEFGMIACISIIPLALIAGHVREIPFYWQCIDMSFGVLGIIPLLMIYKRIKKLQAMPVISY